MSFKRPLKAVHSAVSKSDAERRLIQDIHRLSTTEPWCVVLLTIKAITERLQVKDKTIYAWVTQGRIPALKINGVLRFESEAIEQWLRDCQTPGHKTRSTLSPNRPRSTRDVDHLIESAKRAVYTSHGETRPVASPFRKEEANGTL